MKVVGLTGGIGSGKSTVAKMFEQLGVAVYIADIEAKRLMNEDALVKKQIIDLLGNDSYINEELNRSYIANVVFNDSSKLLQLNAIVHPAVANHFDCWKSKQKGNYVVKEAAILFENEGHKQCDYTILVSAPIETRIERVLKRDKTTREDILSRMNNQWEDARKIPLADFVIYNKNIEDTENQVHKVHREISL
ncbi:dephospho-CoA kinase [Aquimarina sp. EL_43]|uniref:dephospho-CoA kinase n=1 Tax=unclassified Aquimarina TaxID=2627091 RepID=UPI0018CB49FE|nr:MULTISPECIES: dephospho-CoA kinase [unclassified Aquimarina]MBG6132100.1 dephospho-CoA kinase [Aquimarina sp. EL_35]MBG6152897.1 dephospho-CoA kinase [Aquimarina sp. EL_32]MBG6170904.1 dephospho-CoA kinase [Aquimarina sp. EL_43]